MIVGVRMMMIKSNLIIGKYLINSEVVQLYSLLRERSQILIQLLFLKEIMVEKKSLSAKLYMSHKHEM